MTTSSFIAIEMVYKSTNGASRHQVHVIDEVGPASATNLCYVKGQYIDCNMNGELANFGRFVWYACTFTCYSAWLFVIAGLTAF